MGDVEAGKVEDAPQAILPARARMHGLLPCTALKEIAQARAMTCTYSSTQRPAQADESALAKA